MEPLSPLATSLLPPSWRKGYPTTKKIAVDKILRLVECGYASPGQSLTEKEKENERTNIRAILEEMDPKRIFLEHPERVSYDDVDRMIHKLRYEFLGDPLKFEVKGIDPEKVKAFGVDFVKPDRDQINEFLDDPDAEYMETGIHYAITIRWEGGVPKRVSKSLRVLHGCFDMKLFVCVPLKFAGAALLVSAQWSEDKAAPDGLRPDELLLVSTGKCFEESRDVKILGSDWIHVFNKSRLLFRAGDFTLDRKSNIIVYGTRKEGCP